jgi:hypothetical protein
MIFSSTSEQSNNPQTSILEMTEGAWTEVQAKHLTLELKKKPHVHSR